LFGTALADLIAPIHVPLAWMSAVVLVAIAGRGIAAAIARARENPSDPHLERLDETSPRRTYLQFVALTIVNPATVIYFAALILGLPAVGTGSVEKMAFVAGAAAASFAWQILISTAASLLHQRVSPRLMGVLSVIGYGIVLLVAANVARGLVTG
jgi:arginine exporter protein ArgO